MHVITQLSEPEMVKLAVTESSKLLPYVVSSRKTVKLYLKVWFIVPIIVSSDLTSSMRSSELSGAVVNGGRYRADSGFPCSSQTRFCDGRIDS